LLGAAPLRIGNRASSNNIMMKVTSLLCVITSCIVVLDQSLFALAAERKSESLRGRSSSVGGIGSRDNNKGQAPSLEEGNSVSKNNNQRRRHLNEEPFDPTKVKVLVKYKNEQGKQEAKKKAAVEGYESERFSIVSMQIDEKDMLALENDVNIESVSLDQEKHIIFPVNEQESDVSASQAGLKPKPATKTKPGSRRLQEQVPYGIVNIQADQVIPGPDANDITVCVVDTGYDLGHPDLPGAGLVDGNDNDEYGNDGQWDDDGHGHGTHCAGIVMAISDNGIGVRGAVYKNDTTTDGIKLHIGKGLANDGYGSDAGVIEAVDQCIDAGAKIISMSLGGGGSSEVEESMYQTAYENGILIVAAGKLKGEFVCLLF
jgi:subtilisin family serine protease